MQFKVTTDKEKYIVTVNVDEDALDPVDPQWGDVFRDKAVVRDSKDSIPSAWSSDILDALNTYRKTGSIPVDVTIFEIHYAGDTWIIASKDSIDKQQAKDLVIIYAIWANGNVLQAEIEGSDSHSDIAGFYDESEEDVVRLAVETVRNETVTAVEVL